MTNDNGNAAADKDQVVCFQLPAAMLSELDTLATNCERTRSAEIRVAVAAHLERMASPPTGH